MRVIWSEKDKRGQRVCVLGEWIWSHCMICMHTLLNSQLKNKSVWSTRRDFPVRAVCIHGGPDRLRSAQRQGCNNCFGNCGRKEVVSQCLLPPEKDIAHREALDQVGTCMRGGAGKIDWPMGTQKKKAREKDVSGGKVGKHIGETVLKVGFLRQEELLKQKNSSVAFRAKGHL